MHWGWLRWRANLCNGAHWRIQLLVNFMEKFQIAHQCPDITITVVDMNKEKIMQWNSDNLPIFEVLFFNGSGV